MAGLDEGDAAATYHLAELCHHAVAVVSGTRGISIHHITIEVGGILGH